MSATTMAVAVIVETVGRNTPLAFTVVMIRLRLAPYADCLYYRKRVNAFQPDFTAFPRPKVPTGWALYGRRQEWAVEACEERPFWWPCGSACGERADLAGAAAARRSSQLLSLFAFFAVWVTDTAQGLHSQTSRLSWNARQIVRTSAMGLPHSGQWVELKLPGPCSDMRAP
jgi:hypothetical protein